MPLKFDSNLRAWIDTHETESRYRKYERELWRKIDDHLICGFILGMGAAGILMCVAALVAVGFHAG